MRVVPVPVRQDNYAYILMSTSLTSRPKAVFVDPYDVPAVRQAAQKLGLDDADIVGSITTHGHYDHAGGNDAFAKAYPCLLYTSPSPRDKRQSRMPSSA